MLLVNLRQVVGIGLAAQGGSATIVDSTTGVARTAMFLRNDLRFMPQLLRVQARKPLAYWRQLAWRDEPGWGLARMLWLREGEPDVFAGPALYAGAGDLLFFAATCPPAEFKAQWNQAAVGAPPPRVHHRTCGTGSSCSYGA